jgi:hypothetical protein
MMTVSRHNVLCPSTQRTHESQAKAEQRAKRELKAHGLHWQGPKQPNAQASGGSSHSPGNGRRGRGDGKKARYQEQRLARSKVHVLGQAVSSLYGLGSCCEA